MRWPWQSPAPLPPIVDTQVADRLELVTQRLEEIAAELSARVEKVRSEANDRGDLERDEADAEDAQRTEDSENV